MFMFWNFGLLLQKSHILVLEYAVLSKRVWQKLQMYFEQLE